MPAHSAVCEKPIVVLVLLSPYFPKNMELRTRRSSCEASADPVLAVPVRALKRARVVVSTKLKIGFVCGKADGDVVVAPGIPPEFWVRRSRPEEVHTDVAIWWLVRTRYEHSVEADLIHAPHDVTSARLRRNDVARAEPLKMSIVSHFQGIVCVLFWMRIGVSNPHERERASERESEKHSTKKEPPVR